MIVRTVMRRKWDHQLNVFDCPVHNSFGKMSRVFTKETTDAEGFRFVDEGWQIVAKLTEIYVHTHGLTF